MPIKLLKLVPNQVQFWSENYPVTQKTLRLFMIQQHVAINGFITCYHLMIKNINQLTRKLMSLIPVIGLLILLGHELELHLPDIEHWIQSLGSWAPLGFIVLFVLVTPFFVSVDALCFAAGLLFPIRSGELVIISSTYLAAALIFMLGRYYFRQKVVSLLAKHPKLMVLNTKLENQSFKLMLLLRKRDLNPI